MTGVRLTRAKNKHKQGRAAGLLSSVCHFQLQRLHYVRGVRDPPDTQRYFPALSHTVIKLSVL